MKIPIIINNRDLVTWPKQMVEKLKTYNNVGEIIILDNGSTYEPLLEWYSTIPCDIIYGKNLGHTAPWDSGLVKSLDSKYYVVTDSDLGIDNTPLDSLQYLEKNIEKYSLEKLGFGLNWQLTSVDSPYFSHVTTYERDRYNNSKFTDNIFFDVAIDTTFAMYRRQNYFIGGSSTGGEYSAKHFPWYITNDERNSNDEFLYYIKNANNSSSYKTYLNL